MKNNHWTAIWIVLVGASFYFYYVVFAEFFLNKEGIDPLIINFVVAPAFFGLLTVIGLKGKTKLKAIWFTIMPLVPFIILGQEGDPAKPGLQWMLLLGMLVPYFTGGVAMGFLMKLLQKTPNKEPQPTAKRGG